MSAHYHVMLPGEPGNGKLGGRVYDDFHEALRRFHDLAPSHLVHRLTALHCRYVFERGNVVCIREGSEHGGAPIAYFAECTDTDGSCV